MSHLAPQWNACANRQHLETVAAVFPGVYPNAESRKLQAFMEIYWVHFKRTKRRGPEPAGTIAFHVWSVS